MYLDYVFAISYERKTEVEKENISLYFCQSTETYKLIEATNGHKSGPKNMTVAIFIQLWLCHHGVVLSIRTGSADFGNLAKWFGQYHKFLAYNHARRQKENSSIEELTPVEIASMKATTETSVEVLHKLQALDKKRKTR
jgi:hypothetical protein